MEHVCQQACYKHKDDSILFESITEVKYVIDIQTYPMNAVRWIQRMLGHVWFVGPQEVNDPIATADWIRFLPGHASSRSHRGRKPN